MKRNSIEIEFTEFGDLQELCPDDQKLVHAAISATRQSYTPYSGFSVGASVLLDDGSILSGSNQENAAYPSGNCAERTVLAYANSKYPELAVKALAIAASKEGTLTLQPIPPCGGCRQFILESELRYKSPIRILLYGRQKIYLLKRSSDLLPLSFTDQDIK